MITFTQKTEQKSRNCKKLCRGHKWVNLITQNDAQNHLNKIKSNAF